MHRIRLITFDLDETVWPCAPVIAAAEAAHLEWLAAEAERLAAVHDLETLRNHRMELAQRRPELAHDITALRRAALAELLAEHGYAPELADGALRVFLEARHRVSPFPDVTPVLERLGERFILASLTNGNADVRCTPLAGYFDFCLTAADVGAAKPDPALFEAALARAGVAACEALHVGDHPELDVEAARRVGMRAVWLNRCAVSWPSSLQPPDAELADLGALPAFLEASQPDMRG